MGMFTGAKPTSAMKKCLAKLIAWRFHQNNLAAKGKVSMGGKSVSRRSGHLNVVSTACPGAKVYNWLTAKNGLRAQVKKLLNDKGTVDGLKRQGWPSSNKVSIKWSRSEERRVGKECGRPRAAEEGKARYSKPAQDRAQV